MQRTKKAKTAAKKDEAKKVPFFAKNAGKLTVKTSVRAGRESAAKAG